jgi:predicted ATPase
MKEQVSSAAKMEVFDDRMVEYAEKITHKLMEFDKVVLILEDAQFCDELTWKKLERIIDQNIRVLVLITVHVDSFRDAKAFLPSSKVSKGFAAASVQEIGATFQVATDVELKKQLLQSYIYNQISHTRRCRKIVLAALSRDDIENILKASLNISTVSAELVKTVFDISAGNPFWISSMASFINERGAGDFTKAIETKDAQNPLHALILCRLDMLNPEVFHVAKIASIIGDDFTKDMLQHLLPDVKNLTQCLVALKSNGFLYSIANDANAYEFQNPLLTSTIYDLIPVQVQIENHLKMALFIEKTYAANLSGFYNRYRKCLYYNIQYVL